MKKEKNRYKERIIIKSLVGLVILLVLFSTALGFAGYSEFSHVVMDQYEENAFYTAQTASHLVDADQMDVYESSGGTTPEYLALRDTLEGLCNSQGSTFIYVIRPDLTDYAHIKFIFSTINWNSTYTRYDFGYLRDTTNDEYREKYRNLYENRSDREIVVRDKGYIETDPHITAMIPLRDEAGRTQAILCVQRQMDALYRLRHNYVRRFVLTTLIVLLLVLLGQAWYLYRMLISPVRRIMKEAKRFAEENVTPGTRLTEMIPNRDEIGVLAEAVDQMEMKIHHYVENLTKITAENERISAELSLASRIQLGILPRVESVTAGRTDIDLCGDMYPAKEVGGDLYDFFLIDDDHLALVIADVSGKGIPAALFMMVTKVLIKNSLKNGDTPGKALYHVNNLILEGNEAGLFVTVWLMVVELSTGKATVVNAGHERPAIRHAGGRFELLNYRHSPPVAMVENIEFEEREIELKHGDTIFVYTDGVAEANNENGDMFGEARLVEALNSVKAADAAGVSAGVIRAIGEFTADAEQFDDITVLCFKYLGG